MLSNEILGKFLDSFVLLPQKMSTAWRPTGHSSVGVMWAVIESAPTTGFLFFSLLIKPPIQLAHKFSHFCPLDHFIQPTESEKGEWMSSRGGSQLPAEVTLL